MPAITGTPSLRAVHSAGSKDLIFDVVFIHGLNSDGTGAWTAPSPARPFWPSWIANELPGFGVWTIDYEAAASSWFSDGTPMSIRNRAINLLALLRGEGVGERPLCFVTHSMGGLIAKQMLFFATVQPDEYKEIAANIKGIVFIATPHRGARIANWAEYLRFFLQRTVAVHELQADESFLLSLGDWYQAQAPGLGVKTLAFAETRPTRGIMVVDAASAEPGIGHAIPVDADHVGISKPDDPGSLVYKNVTWFLRLLAQKEFQPPAALHNYMLKLNEALLNQFRSSPYYFPLTLQRWQQPAEQPHDVATDGSLTELLRDQRRIYLRGAAGAGKSLLVARLTRELFSHGQVSVFINLKSWTNDDSETLRALNTRPVDERFDFLLSRSLIDVTVEQLKQFPEGAQLVVLADGLNEVYANGRGPIVRTLDEWVRHHPEGPAVVVTDRLSSTSELFDQKWTHYLIQPIAPDAVKEQIELHLEDAGDYAHLSEVNRALLSSPYFLRSVLQTGKLILGSAADAIAAFFTDELHIPSADLATVAEAALEALLENRALTFSEEWMEGRIGTDRLTELVEDGVLIREGNDHREGKGKLHFDHQLKHDFLAARALAGDNQRWTGSVFDSLTFKGASFNALAMTLQQLSSMEDGNRFLREVYNWSWPGALICLAEARKTGHPSHPRSSSGCLSASSPRSSSSRS